MNNAAAAAGHGDGLHRRSIRLQGYDYTQAGAYSITLCTQDRACLFGDVVDGVMCPTDAGRMLQTVWDDLPVFYPGVDVDACAVMPNHIHGIVVLVGAAPCGRPDAAPCGRPDAAPCGRPDAAPCGRPDAGSHGRVDLGQPDAVAPGRPQQGQPRGVAPTRLSLADVVHRFKTMTTKRYVDGVKQSAWAPFRGRLWQRNYYEHIIRDDGSLNRIRRYINDNPARWAFDRDNPAAIAPEYGRGGPPWSP